MSSEEPTASLSGFSLASRHLSLPSCLLSDGPMTVNELAARLEVAPTTVSLMVGGLSRRGILDRGEDENDRGRTIVSIAGTYRADVESRLTAGARARRTALDPLTADQRRMFIDTLLTYEREVERERG
ncbi:hypothetical protein GCM10027445_05200 [Amycolatopsis endophytica]|uniref:DNA-binding MarR family transcriptional regulator n=1 Tax=Amycolatopsis endophytica TaxID=860233 RepID=A0A853B8M6_9PSEU|nr:MarR family winged helix-turn-helix transcriptional regulator [Amycolatopsis endophytica]NYI91145.1 DNA-binding MarR family transcriptional regulator [Amycolatopsis endophytica]